VDNKLEKKKIAKPVLVFSSLFFLFRCVLLSPSVCLFVLGACLNARDVSSFTHSSSFLCIFVRILSLSFSFSLSVMSHYSYIQLLLHTRVSCLFSCVCLYIDFVCFFSLSLSLLSSPHWNNPSKIQCIFAAARQWTLYLFSPICLFFFVCSSFHRKEESCRKLNLFDSIRFQSHIHTLSLYLACSEMIKTKKKHTILFPFSFLICARTCEDYCWCRSCCWCCSSITSYISLSL